jgi:hypothetical protein
MTMKVFAVACMAALCGCAGLVRETREPAVERLDGSGVSSRTLLIESGNVLRLVNADARPHQIYSNDCGEVSSTLLNPGDIYVARIGAGPKVCHFQDLLSPLDAGYSGTLQVHSQEPKWLETVDD